MLHPSAETVELAPLYDTVPTALWPQLRQEAAMSIGGRVMLAEVTVDDIVREARTWSHPEGRSREAVAATARALLDAIAGRAIPPDSDVAAFVRRRAQALVPDLEGAAWRSP